MTPEERTAGRDYLIGFLAAIIVHFRYFLHVDFKRTHRDDLQLVLFTGLIVFLMVGGTIWVIGNEVHMMSGNLAYP